MQIIISRTSNETDKSNRPNNLVQVPQMSSLVELDKDRHWLVDAVQASCQDNCHLSIGWKFAADVNKFLGFMW